MTTRTPPHAEAFDLYDYLGTYPTARAKGFVDWNPQPATVDLLDRVTRVLEEYRDHLPLTARQVFYRLVGNHGYDKTEKAYKRLLSALDRGRRAGFVPWTALRDDGVTTRGPGGWSSVDQCWDSMEYTAARFSFHSRTDQPTTLLVFVEAAGMVPQVHRVASRYGATTLSSGGFNSTTAKYEVARDIARDDRPTVVLHVGDYDPSGESVFASLAADVQSFVRGMNSITPDFVRVAVTEAQVEAYDLPSSPRKRTDQRGDWHSRHGAGAKLEATQAEAFTPDELAAVIRTACEHYTDLDILADVKRRGEAERAGMVTAVRGAR